PSRGRVERALRPDVSWNQDQQCDGTDHGEGRPKQEHAGMSDMVPKPSTDKARHQAAQSHDRIVPADPACAQLRWPIVAGERLADGAEYSLIEAVENEEHADQHDVRAECKTEIGGKE